MGMTYAGKNGGGVIFKTDGNGNNQQVIHSFIVNPGKNPYYIHLCQASNGNLYGMTAFGGAGGNGVLFEYNPTTSTYTKKIDFDDVTNGRLPRGALIQAANGKLYGMTQAGGSNGYGVLFEYDPVTSMYSKKFDFDGATSGGYPYGSLMQAANGKLYGMTYFGGANNIGVLFEYNLTTSVYTKKIDFAGVTNGSNPYGFLTQASNGKLYGMTNLGGVNNLGVLFEYDPATSTYLKKLDFNGAVNGSYPLGSLIQASNGKLYGMASEGGANNLGVLFEYNPATSTYLKKIDFSGLISGSIPKGSLMQSSSGKLFGMTSMGGSNNFGLLFEYDFSTSTFTKKFDFDGVASGSYPYGSPMQAADGKLYGVTYNGGVSNNGVLFEYDPTTSIYTKKINIGDYSDGADPYGSLILASNGKSYGMTTHGGLNNFGVLFELDPVTYTFIKKIDFTNTANGSRPYGSLIQASNGKFYGVTLNGGTAGYGVLFEYEPTTSTLVKKLDFDGVNNGSRPNGSLVQASNGKLYGMTSDGGTNNLVLC
jgi:uncharacterized repeat protein (TIGR03803 family)